MSGVADIAVVGGGLVGASLAWGFQRSGASVTLIDAGDGLADDYQRIGDVSGQVVLVRRGPAPGWPNYSITEAVERGAAAIVFYDYARVPLPDAIRQDSVWYRDTIPSLSISTNSAQQLKKQTVNNKATQQQAGRCRA